MNTVFLLGRHNRFRTRIAVSFWSVEHWLPIGQYKTGSDENCVPIGQLITFFDESCAHYENILRGYSLFSIIILSGKKMCVSQTLIFKKCNQT